MESGGSIRAIQWSLSWDKTINFFIITSISIIVLYSHLRLCLPIGIYFKGLPVNILKAHLFFSVLATCHTRLNLLYSITLTVLGKIQNMNFFILKSSPPSLSFLLNPLIRPRNVFFNVLSLCSILNIIDHISI